MKNPSVQKVEPKRKRNKVANNASYSRYGLGANDANEMALLKDLFIELQKSELKYDFNDYIPFLTDDNFLISRIDFLSKASPTLGSILSSKTNMIVGAGLNIYKRSQSSIFQSTKKIDLEVDENDMLAIDSYFSNVYKGRDFQEVLNIAARDYVEYGNAFIQLVKTDNKLLVINTPVSWCRPKKCLDGSMSDIIGVSSEFVRGTNNPSNIIDVPVYPDFGEVEIKMGDDTIVSERSIIHLKDYQPNSNYWGLPDWLATQLYCEIEYRIGRFNISQFENGFSPSAIVTMGGVTTDPDETEDFVDNFTDSFTNTGNDSKVLFYLVENPDYKLDVQLLSQIKEGHFTELAQIAAQQIVTGCSWSTSLAGIQTAGQLGSNQQLRAEFSKLQNMVINPIQKLFEKKLINPILKEAANVSNNINAEGYYLELAKVNPISLSSDIVPSEVLTIDEQRQQLGYEALTREEQNEELQNNENQ